MQENKKTKQKKVPTRFNQTLDDSRKNRFKFGFNKLKKIIFSPEENNS